MTKAANKANMNNKAANPVLEWERIPDDVQKGVEALKDKKVEDIRVYDLRGFTPFCDFVILGTAYSSAQAKVAKEGIADVMDSIGVKVYGVEGDVNSNWLLIDFWDIVVHLFRPETRTYYNLEALWGDFPWWPGELKV